MKSLFGLMLMMSLTLFAGTVYADHAPPNQTAEVSISLQDDAPAIASIELIAPVVATTSMVGYAEVICPMTNSACETAKSQIAVDSGQGYKRCESFITTFKNRNSDATGWVIKDKYRRLHKPGHNSIARHS